MAKKVLIVGGVAGGASVAARVRRLDEQAEVTMFERGPNVSFSNCCLPFFLSRTIEESDSLVLMDPVQFDKQYNINAKVNSEVIQIKPEEHKVVVKNVLTGETYEEEYDKLFLSPGANPIMPKSIKGIDGAHVFPVRNVPDIVKIDDYIKNNKVTDVAVIGGGFIGIEVMENLKMSGVNVTLVEAANQVMVPFDKDMAQLLQTEIINNGVDLIVSDGLAEIKKDCVVTVSGKEVKAQVVIMAIGVRPEVSLAVAAGVELGVTGGIKVDHNYQTNLKDVYAVGDAIETYCSLIRKPSRLTLAGPAQRQARGAADHMYGRTVQNKGVIGSSCVHIFGLNAANTGLNEKQCTAAGIQYDYVYIIPGDKVGIMPASNQIHLKLLFEVPTGKILGCQAVGRGNVDKRVDVIATMLTMGGTLEQLKELELCYSPMFSTAKDPLNHAALVALNILNGDFKQVKVTEVRDIVENGGYIIDVREPNEWEQGHIKTAHNIPMSEFRQRLDEIPTDRPVYLHCRSAQRSYNVTRALGQLGFDNVYNISGSYLGICCNQYFEDVQLNRDKIVTEYNFK
ncbi:MAG: FAD-dependent oxidoreductase [Tenericutes bacterium]|nr:FAD-dependent oxidoreductase [Mycoplasmatota bacterium]